MPQPEIRSVDRPRPGRACGPCRVCCKLPDIPELNKPLDRWCPHVNPSRSSSAGCTIFGSPERPPICGEFMCGWLAGIGEDADRPDRLGVLMQPTLRAGSPVLAFVEFRPGALASERAQALMADIAARTTGAAIVRRAFQPGFSLIPITVNRVSVTPGILDKLGRVPTG